MTRIFYIGNDMDLSELMYDRYSLTFPKEELKGLIEKSQYLDEYGHFDDFPAYSGILDWVYSDPAEKKEAVINLKNPDLTYRLIRDLQENGVDCYFVYGCRVKPYSIIF